MNRELRLRNAILDRYVSLRQFAEAADVPYSTVMTILSRGIGGASFDTVLKICRALEIDPGEI
ncbi:MAG: helix-turn-helix transcriptional regulator [Clostridia bacterium]|nr:helix-turn-helix transcriptional regulator [Clostridia bacterium]